MIILTTKCYGTGASSWHRSRVTVHRDGILQNLRRDETENRNRVLAAADTLGWIQNKTYKYIGHIQNPSITFVISATIAVNTEIKQNIRTDGNV